MPAPIISVDASSNLAAGDCAARTAEYGKALSLLASLFFMWGFITVINNTLLPHLRKRAKQSADA